jgi:signal peptidase I
LAALKHLTSIIRSFFSSGTSNGVLTYVVPGVNMEPAIKSGSSVYVDSRAYHASPIKRADVVAYKSPSHVLVMRVVALPGEVVELREGELYVNDIRCPEPYLDLERAEQEDSQRLVPTQIPDDCVYVLGDFRDMSKDSRFEGPVKISDIVGRVVKVKHAGRTRDVRRVE